LAWGEALHQQVSQEVGACLARYNVARKQHGCLRMKHVFVRVQGEKVEIALFDLERSRQRWRAKSAAQHDIKLLKRYSSRNATQWQSFIYGYQNAFGSTFKGL
jgi:hypothetical protein